MLLKWSRSRKIALSGEAVRLAWATMRLSVSSTRALVRQPGERVGRRAPLGQRQVAEVREHRRGLGDRLVDAPAVEHRVGAPPMPTSTEPMTSPPTSSGWHTDASGSLPQISHS